MTNQTQTGAGWYPDPWQGDQLRYWDGATWTGHTAAAPAGQPQPAPPLPATDGVASRRPWWQRRWAIITAVVGVLVLFGSLIPDDEVTPSADTTATEPTSSPSTPAPEVRKDPVKAEVPAVRGLSVAEARQALREAGLRIGQLQRQPSARAAGTVLSQAVGVGAARRLGTTIPLVIAIPLPQVPSVVGKGGSTAASILRAAGFRVTTSTETRTSGSSGVVLSQTPSGGVSVQPGKTIHLVITKVVAPAPPPEDDGGGNCTPGYTPCLAPAHDYDCAGGSGDGPKYTGFVRVTGSDPYGLDADGDGVGCES